MKKNLTRAQVQELAASIDSINKSGEKLGIKFNYAIQRTLAAIRPELQAIVEVQKSTQTSAQDELEALRKKYADVGPDGKPIFVDGRYQIKQNEAAFRDDFNAFNKRVEAKNTELQAFDREEVEVDIHELAFNLIENEKLTGEQLRGLLHILKDAP